MLTIGMKDNLNQPGDQRRRGVNRRDNGKPGLHQPPLPGRSLSSSFTSRWLCWHSAKPSSLAKLIAWSARASTAGVDVIALNRRGEILLLAEGRQHFSHARRQIGAAKGSAASPQ
jgi:hypothetical protein